MSGPYLKIIVGILAIGSVLLPQAAFAETLLLENGDIIRGRITLEDRNTIVVETESGPRSFEKKDVRKVFYSQVQEDDWRKDNPQAHESSQSSAETSERSFFADMDWSAGAANLVLPGYAQWRRGDRFRAGIFFVSTLASLAWLDRVDRRYRSTRNDYDTVTDTLFVWPGSFAESLVYAYQLSEENQLYSQGKIQGKQRLHASFIFAAVYVAQLLDALVGGFDLEDSRPARDGPDTGFHFEVLPDSGSVDRQWDSKFFASGEFKFSFTRRL